MRGFFRSLYMVLIVVGVADFFAPVDIKEVVLDYVFVLLIWNFFHSRVEKNRTMNLHKNYMLTLYALMVIGSAVTPFVIDKWGNSLSAVYMFTAITVLLLGEDSGEMVGFTLSFLIFIHFNRDAWILLSSILMTMIATRTLKEVYRRSDVMKSAFYASIGNLFVSILKYIIDGYAGTYEFYISFLNPIVSSIFILGILPYIEYTSRIYSNIGLMELGNLNNPILKELSIKAPGTYQHSTMVANLSEAAAEKIGANSLLARVASYYHDIGKMKRSAFFVENQFDGTNPHDEISPFLSHLILDEHVKYGLELAKKYRLPIPVECVISEHHGTRVQKYFYYKAKEIDPNVSEDDFRYPGPKPRFKESGIIMLADSVEAASRTLKNRSHSHIKSLVEDIVMGIFSERQLDSSGLTLEDLELIIDEFTRVITTFYHRRVEYPKEEISV